MCVCLSAASKKQLKRPWSAPAAKSGDAWTSSELSRYDVTVVPVDTIAELFSRSHITEANLPPLSTDAKLFVASCESINFISTNTPHFPAAEEHVGRHVAKLVFLAEKHFSQYEGVVDDCVAAILHYLGFNKGSLVVLSVQCHAIGVLVIGPPTSILTSFVLFVYLSV